MAQLNLRQDIPRLIEKLKNASKNGDIVVVWRQLRALQVCIDSRYNRIPKEHTINFATNYFRLWTRYIFVLDSAERTALYYASLTGHHHIVELYMSLYLMTVIQISEATVAASRTFRGWFFTMGGTNKIRLSNNFTLKHYDTCVLNGLNKEVGHVLTRKKFTISDAMNIVKEAMNPDVYDNISVPKSIGARIANITLDMDRIRKLLRVVKSTKRKKPALNNRMLEGRCEDYYNNDLCVIDENDEDSYTGIVSEYDKYVDGAITIDEHECAQDIIHKTERREYPDLSVASSIIIDEQSFFEMVATTEDLDSFSDFTILNDANSIDYSHISLIKLCSDDDDNNDYEDEETIQGWDVVSDIKSVKSIDTFMMTNSNPAMLLSISYRDILLKEANSIVLCDGVANEAPKNALPIINKESKSMNEVEIAITEEEADNDDEMCDAHWERDGYKNGRGGKTAKLFLGNSSSWGNYPKHFSSRWYPPIEGVRRRDLKMRCRKMTNQAHNRCS
mmetsp:Transcript_3179/g.6576  ORF Transcript_3179/g.6576 Transcript_3179/m.6576 type:complete len:504 (+) Transcript_3179:145-1656(+)|eukprot:CAMPEP_0194328856 /NCGR_PEP_ID=MMETSP0171-20130528/46185_1 /TAXON_ID=218684 /ORGANISM="Corethron pennatum, Strain L29A3" /LENGTH=503 /DNA_ID=CAMNT_0039089359 /DNA_START=95 /DNA_END=1602 /DNA_ORIENTATION=-